MKNRIKEFRVKNDWKQYELAKRVNISRQTISLIERNKSIPSVDIAVRISKAFVVNIEDLFILEEEDLVEVR